MDTKKIINFIKSPGNSEEGYKELFKLFKKISDKYNLNKDLEDNYHEFITSNIFEKTKLKEIIEKTDDNGLIFYLKTMIKNFLINSYREKRYEESVISLNERISSENENDEFIDFIKDEVIEKVTEIESLEILEEIKVYFSEDKQRLLCEILYREKRKNYKFIKDMSENAFYKAVERFKVELGSFFLKLQSSDEAVKYFLYHIYPSEICEKFCLNS